MTVSVECSHRDRRVSRSDRLGSDKDRGPAGAVEGGTTCAVSPGIADSAAGVFSAGVDKPAAGVLSSGTAGLAAVALSSAIVPS